MGSMRKIFLHLGEENVALHGQLSHNLGYVPHFDAIF